TTATRKGGQPTMSTAADQQRIKALLAEGKDILDTARLEGRERTPEEEHRVVDIHTEVKRLRDSNGEVDAVLSGAETVEEITQAGVSGTGQLGDFIHSEGYKKIKSASGRGQTWSSGAVEIQTKGTLLSTPATGGTFVPPQYQPGVVSTLFQPIGLADYFGQG